MSNKVYSKPIEFLWINQVIICRNYPSLNSGTRSLNKLFGCKDAAQQVLMSVCLCETQVEILPSYSIQCNSVQFQNVQECSRMFKNVQECSRMLTVSKSKSWNNNVMQLNSIYVHSLGCPRLPKVAEGCRRLPKVRWHAVLWDCRHFNGLACSSKSRNAVPWPCITSMIFHAVPLFVWAAHKNFAVLV